MNLSLFIRILVVLPLIWTVPVAQANLSAKPTLDFDSYVHMRLTHTLFQGVLASFFDEKDDTYQPIYLANKVYLQTFLNVWSKKIESEKYPNTNAIFAEMNQSQGYLSKYFTNWNGIRDFRGARLKIDMGGYREQFLNFVLTSESRFPNLDERIQKILQMANIFLVTSAQQYALGQVIASPFLKAANSTTRQVAQGILTNIPFQQKANYAVLAFDILALIRGGTGVLNAPKLLNTPRLIKTPNVLRSAGKGFAGISRTLKTSSKRAFNPIFRRMNSSRWSLLASATAHSAAVGTLFFQFQPAAEQSQAGQVAASQEVYHSNAFAVGSLFEIFNAAYPYSFFLIDYQDFAPHFETQSQEQLVSQVRDSLQHGTRLDYGDAFIAAEKLQLIDQRSLDDVFAMDFVKGRYDLLKRKVANLFGNQIITDEKIEAFRALVIEDALYNYKRDYPNLISTLLNWGGNCVAQTMLMIALLEPYQIQLPTGTRLVLTLWSDHIEAGLWDGSKLTHLISGNRTERITGTVYYPHFLLVLMLRNYPGALKDLKYAEPRVFKPKSGVDKSTNWFTSVGKALGIDSDKDQRFGILESFEMSDLDPGVGGVFGGSGSGGSDVPYSAIIGYSQIGDFGDYLSRLSDWSESGGQNNRGRGMVRPKPPEFTISINLVPTKGVVFTRFSYESATKNLTVFDEQMYMEFMRKRREPKMTNDIFEGFIYEKHLEEVDRFTQLPLLQKVYGVGHGFSDPEKGFSALLKITDADLDLNAFAIEELNALTEKVFQLPGDPARFDFFELADKSSLSRFQTGRATIRAETTATLRKLADGELQLLKNIIRNPRAFLKVYNEANLKLRNHLLVRFFGSSFWTYGAQGRDAKLLALAKAKIRDYLGNLNEVKIVFERETNWICSKIEVNLPKLSKDWPWLVNAGQDCGKDDPKIYKVDRIAAPLDTKPVDGREKLELKLSILIELTVGFGRGLQLWTPQVVDAFVDGRYSQIGPDRVTSIRTAKNILQSEPTLWKDPRYRRLKSLASPQIRFSDAGPLTIEPSIEPFDLKTESRNFDDYK